MRITHENYKLEIQKVFSLLSPKLQAAHQKYMNLRNGADSGKNMPVDYQNALDNHIKEVNIWVNELAPEQTKKALSRRRPALKKTNAQKILARRNNRLLLMKLLMLSMLKIKNRINKF